MSTTSTTINGNDQVNLPYGRLESPQFGTYDIWQEKTIVGKKSHRQDVDVNMGTKLIRLIVNRNRLSVFRRNNGRFSNSFRNSSIKWY